MWTGAGMDNRLRRWLYVMAAAPSVVELFPRLVLFLREALAKLPMVPGGPLSRTGPGARWGDGPESVVTFSAL